MCGRTSLFVPLDDLESRFDAEYVADGGYRPRFNIAPHQPIEVISNGASDEIDQYTWGLLPPWADDLNDGFINARSETAHEKRSFKDAWESRPCLVLSSGFYEWQKPNGGPKQPYRIYREDDVAFAMAGLWQEWNGDGDDSLRSVTILTTEPNDVVEPIHDRMPVVLPETEEDLWLAAGPDERRELCRPYPEDDLDTYPISTTVNNPENDTATVIEPLGNEQSGLGEFA
jgi:putative SOS response-associated peptidase YedK